MGESHFFFFSLDETAELRCPLPPVFKSDMLLVARPIPIYEILSLAIFFLFFSLSGSLCGGSPPLHFYEARRKDSALPAWFLGSSCLVAAG